MADERDRIDGHGPLRDELVEHRGELASVLRDVEAAVVTDVDGGRVEIARERLAVIVAAARPLPVVHRRAVHEHDDARARFSFDPQRHRERERVVRRLEVIAEDAVEHRGDRVALRAGLALAEDGVEPLERVVDAHADELRDPADARVDRRGEEPRGRAADRVVHLLDGARDARGRVDDELARAAEIARVVARLLRGHGFFKGVSCSWII